MSNLGLFSLVYDLITYLVAFRSLIDEILYKLGFKRQIDIERDLPTNLEGHVAIVTGGTRGIGLTVVRSLLRKGCQVFVATSQKQTNFARLEKRIYQGVPDRNLETGVKRGIINLQYLDLSSMDSVQQFVKYFKATKFNLNYLICNAGIMFAPRQITIDNFESHLAVNYIGHCLLILELLPELKRAADRTKSNSRIISVSSSTHRATKFRFDDILGESNYSSTQAYAQSKLAQIMFSAKLSRYLREELQWQNVQTFSLHPGVVLSELYEHVNLIKYFPFLVPIIRLVTRDVIQGAETTLYATLSNDLNDKSGLYLEDCDIKEPSKWAQNLTEQERLWDLTRGLLSLWLTNLDITHP